MTSKLTISSINLETAGADVRQLQEALCLLEKLQMLLEQSGKHDLAELAVQALRQVREALRCIRMAAQKYENAELTAENADGTRRLDAAGLADAAARLVEQVPTHEAWACPEQSLIDRHIADGGCLARQLSDRLRLC